MSCGVTTVKDFLSTCIVCVKRAPNHTFTIKIWTDFVFKLGGQFKNCTITTVLKT